MHCIVFLFLYILLTFILCGLAVYLYSFDRFFGFDKVCLLAEMTGKKKIKAGDLLVFGNQYFLALGETLSFSEQYQHLATTQAELVYKGFLSAAILKLFHWMVDHHYTTYKSVVRLFFSPDIEKLLERESKSVKSVKSKVHTVKSLSAEGQTLIVFPDLRTMTNAKISDDFKKMSDDCSIVTLLSSNTQNQKDVHRWEIKKGLKSVIICTYAEIFQDFHTLKKIIFIDPHKWYYASQQDPRYKVGEVIEQMKELYGAEVEIIGV